MVEGEKDIKTNLSFPASSQSSHVYTYQGTPHPTIQEKVSKLAGRDALPPILQSDFGNTVSNACSLPHSSEGFCVLAI